ncbi:MAG: sigma-70 family RNA polymerase sigma factor [Bacteroidales bacterium]|jgi:RNA polymerase sigma factor (sigma-70 family)|nr:sigma-70 family RNA polymerase sigma factor [Bacteroidales bacterium]HPM11232.1 sigma-70 family RNA polymerase sigma factor [Paludibacter sp.]
MKTLNHLTDDILVKLYVEGNNAAFEVLLTRYQSRVYYYIFQIVRDKELTEDIFQETFIKAIMTIRQGRYQDSGKFLAWINRIAHNLVIDHFRKQKNENTISADSYDYDIFQHADISDLSIEDILSNEQVLRDVVKMVNYLPAVQQEVVRMRFFENLSFKEIAEKTEVSINTALGRMRYALLNMRKLATENNVYLEMK